MAFFFPSINTQPNTGDDHNFSLVVDRLKIQNALPQDCFTEEIPFFNIPCISKETQIRELFENSCDAKLCKHLLSKVAPLPEGAEHNLVPSNYSPISVMSFAQIVLYKALPCPHGNCANYPREIATHNQYKDYEYQCPFYHHDKDRRRLVIYETVNEEFVYKANYFEEGKRKGEKEKYSQNYFESMFHPLYYKMFKCKRDFCNQSAFCPFFHCEEEKNTWDRTFNDFVGKDRTSYIKDRPQRGAEKKYRGPQYGRLSSSDEEASPLQPQGLFAQHGYTKQYNNYIKPYQKYTQHGYYEEVKYNFEQNWKNPVMADRKDSDSSFEENNGSYGFFSKLQNTPMSYGVY